MLICQLTDLHIRPEGVAAYRVVETNKLVERALRVVAALDPRPDVVVVSGDLTDCGLVAEYRLLAGLLQHYLPMPVYVVPGNHDRRENLRAELAFLPGISQGGDFIHYAVEDHPVRLVMLDTVVPGAGHGALCPARLDFLDRTLSAQPDRPTIVVMHHPPFACGIEELDRIGLRDSDAFAAAIARHRQVERVLCGHHHRPLVARVAHAICTVAPSVVHQSEFTMRPGAPGRFVLEPAAFELHTYMSAAHGIVSHQVLVEQFPGPYPYLRDPDYPGATP